MTLSIARKLSMAESSFFNNGCNNINVIAVNLSNKLDINVLQQAANEVMSIHPALRRTIINKQGTIEFLSASQSLIVEEYQASSWEKIVKDNLQDPFLEEGDYFWKLTQVVDNQRPESSTLLLFLHLSISDSVGGMILVNDIIKNYHLLCSGESVVQKQREVLPDLLTLQNNQRTYQDSLTHQNSSANQSSVTHQLLNTQLDYHNSQSGSDLKYNTEDNEYYNDFCYLLGKESNLEKLKEICSARQIDIDLILFLTANWAMAKFEWQQQASLQETIRINMSMDINERNNLLSPLGYNDIQSLTSTLPWKSHIQLSDTFWDSIETLNKLLQSRLPYTHDFEQLQEHLLRNNQPGWLTDAHFSSLVGFPFQKHYEQGTIEHIHLIRSHWAPLYGRYAFLANSVNGLSYTIVAQKHDTDNAKMMIKYWRDLVEEWVISEEEFALEDFVRTRVS